MYPERTFSSVVLPAPVPPEIRKFSRPFHHGRQQLQHGLGQGLVLDHVAGGDRIAAETPNRKAGAVDGQRRNDGVHTGAVGQARIHHGRGLIHAPSDARDDAVDDLHQVRVVFEAQAGGLEFARPFHIDPVVAVDQDVGDGGIFEQRLERAQAEDLIQNFPGQALALGKAERHGLAVHRVPDQQQHFFAGGVAGGAPQFLQIEAVKDLAVKIGLDLLVLGSFEGLQIRHTS